MNHPLRNPGVTACAVAVLALAGCGGPSKVNVELRKQNQVLSEQVETLKRQHDGDLASLAAKEKGGPTTLSSEKLDQLFTAVGIKLNNLTAWRGDSLKVYVTPIDAAGDPLKTAGALTVDAFDLAKADKPQLGHWEFPAAEAGKNWYESIIVRGYALTCPLAPPAAGSEITVRVTFVDSLTQRTLTGQKVITVTATALAPK